MCACVCVCARECEWVCWYVSVRVWAWYVCAWVRVNECVDECVCVCASVSVPYGAHIRALT